MERLITLRRCLLALALALVQLFVPVWAYSQMSRDGSLLVDVCSASAARQVAQAAGDSQGSGQAAVADHPQHCTLCGASPAILAPAAPVDAIQPMPGGAIRVGGVWYQPGTPAFTPPATGPPHLA